jgi:hypothetical protein
MKDTRYWNISIHKTFVFQLTQSVLDTKHAGDYKTNNTAV